MWQLLETVVALAVNHHMDGAQAAQFEDFYDNNLRGKSKLFYSKMEETTVQGKPMDMADRMANLRDGFSVVYRTHEREQVLDWWVGRKALWLNTSVPSNMTDISIFRHSELGADDKLHRLRMEVAAAQAEMLMGVFHDEVLLVVRSDCPEERVSQLVSEGLPLQEILADIADEFPAPQRITPEALRATPEAELQSWYIMAPDKNADA